MLAEKKPLGVEVLEAQTALELPDREMMQVNVGGGLVNVNIGPVSVDVSDVDVAAAANVCANVLTADSVVNCDAQANTQ